MGTASSASASAPAVYGNRFAASLTWSSTQARASAIGPTTRQTVIDNLLAILASVNLLIISFPHDILSSQSHGRRSLYALLSTYFIKCKVTQWPVCLGLDSKVFQASYL